MICYLVVSYSVVWCDTSVAVVRLGITEMRDVWKKSFSILLKLIFIIKTVLIFKVVFIFFKVFQFDYMYICAGDFSKELGITSGGDFC